MSTPFFKSSRRSPADVSLPPEFFTGVLPKVRHLGELKVILYTFWFISRQESKIHYITLSDFLQDTEFLGSFGGERCHEEGILLESLQLAVKDQILLADSGENQTPVYFINDKEGQAALSAYQQKYWLPAQEQPISLEAERPTIFKLYEENLGPLTPIIAETLQDAEKTYPLEWIEEAIKAAVKNNVRRWNYVEAILKRWKEEGRNEKDQRSREPSRKKYIQGEYGDLIKH